MSPTCRPGALSTGPNDWRWIDFWPAMPLISYCSDAVDGLV